MNTDPIIAEVRAARETLAAKFNYDVAAIVRDAQRRQKESKLKVVSLQPRRGTWPAQAALPLGSAVAASPLSSVPRKRRPARAVR